MITAQNTANPGDYLSENEIFQTLSSGLAGKFTGQKVLVLIPDHTRSLPLPLLFRFLVEILSDTRQLDFMVALGTHPPLSLDKINLLLGISEKERKEHYQHIRVLNHTWNNPSSLATLGTLNVDQIKELAAHFWHPTLPEQIEVKINKFALEYDQILILGPTFPHEVAGFSGGAKYLFPGISGPEMIDATHWLGALAGVVNTIGIENTPVRAMIHTAAKLLPTPITLIALVVTDHKLCGVYIGDYLSAWRESINLSAQRHILWCQKPFHTVLSCAPIMYDELWTAAKAMYKLEPVVAQGGKVIIYAPHLETISKVHGHYLYEIGYHILPYFLENWDQYRHIPLGVLAHSTHLRGSGIIRNGEEKPNIHVVLASRIPAEDCARLNLGYMDPSMINLNEFQNREDEGILVVPRAGETLFKISN